MANSETNNSKYAIFIFLGIFTFFLSGFALQGIHPPMSIYLMLVIYGVLFAGGLLVSKEWSPVFILKAFAMYLLPLLLISMVFFDPSAPSHEYSESIEAEKLEIAPDKFVFLTEEELNEYPTLKKALRSPGEHFYVNPEEFERTIDLLNEKGIYEIKVGNNYYSVSFSIS